MPVLKHQLDNLDGLDASLHGYYEKNEGGKYFLQVQGMVAKQVVDEFRTNNIELKNKLEALKDVDPAEYTRLKKLEADFKGKTPDEATIEKVVLERTGAMKSDFENKYKVVETENKTMRGQLEVLVIDNSIRSAAAKAGVRPEAIDDVILRAKTVYKYENGQAIPHDSKGQVLYGKDGQTPMSPEEWTTGLKTTAPHLFPGSTGTGATGPGAKGHVDRSKMSPAQKIVAGLEEQAQ
jgi:ribosomal protein L14